MLLAENTEYLSCKRKMLKRWRNYEFVIYVGLYNLFSKTMLLWMDGSDELNY